MLLTNFERISKKLMAAEVALELSLCTLFLIYPGLPLIIFMLAITVIFRPSLPISLLTTVLAIFFHLLFLGGIWLEIVGLHVLTSSRS
jgi:hypothetical protein